MFSWDFGNVQKLYNFWEIYNTVMKRLNRGWNLKTWNIKEKGLILVNGLMYK
jgi:hypothetical protein